MDLKTLIQKFRDGEEVPEDLDAFLDDFIPNVLLKSESLQQAYGVSDKEMEELYAKGYSLYEEEDFGEASVIFRWLILLNSFDVRYWMGLAACRQVLALYEKALHAYAVAALLAHEDPTPHYYAYACYVDLGDTDNATKALKLAHVRTLGKPLFSEMREELEAKGALCT